MYQLKIETKHQTVYYSQLRDLVDPNIPENQ